MNDFDLKIMAIRAFDELCVEIWGCHLSTAEFDVLWDMSPEQLSDELMELFSFMIMKKGL